MASLKVSGNRAPPHTPSFEAHSSDGPRFLRLFRRSRSDITPAKLTKQYPSNSTPTVAGRVTSGIPDPPKAPSSHVHGVTSGDSKHLAALIVPESKPSRLEESHNSGINRTNLNTLEKLLKSIDSLHSLVKTILNDDLYADLPIDDRNALDAGILGDLACMPGHLQDDLKWFWKQARLKLFSGELIDDRNERVVCSCGKFLAADFADRT